MAASKEYSTMVKCEEKLMIALKSDREIALFLHQQQIIKKELYDEINEPKSMLSATDKVVRLLTAIKDRVSVERHHYHTFVDHMRLKPRVYGDIVGILDREYHGTSVSPAASINPPSASIMPEAHTGNIDGAATETGEFSMNFGPDEFAKWLSKKYVPQGDCDIIKEKNIPGILFMGLTREELEKYGISVIGVRVIMALQEKNKQPPPKPDTGKYKEPELTEWQTSDRSEQSAKNDWPQGNRVESDGGKETEYEATDRGSFTPRLKLHVKKDELTKMNPELKGPHRDHSDMKFYPMKEKKHGVAWIINNKDFEDKLNHQTREGTERDEDNLVETLRFLGYRIKIFRNLTKQETHKLFTDIDKDLSESNIKAKNEVANDSFICCILSHGDKGQIICSDSESIKIETIERLTANSKMLENKPKIFFIQACRGKNYGSINQIQADGEVWTSKRAHFYLCYATVDGDKAYRNDITGSWFITEVCKLLCEKGKWMSLHSDFQILLNERVASNDKYVYLVSQDGKKSAYMQQPTCSNQLQSHVHFFNT